ncbi:MAG: VTC domain-containing protein [Prolixibacteraceae bacterium]
MKSIENILNAFESVSLAEANQKTGLMTRIDRKYWFPLSLPGKVLSELQSICDVPEVNGKRIINYQTTYFDTPENDMYLHHHNGQMERYKVRKRKYETSPNGFFEIKQKQMLLNRDYITSKK